MKRLVSVLALAATCLLAERSASATAIDDDYRQALTHYFEVGEDVIGQLITSKITPEEMPVALLIHQLTDVSIQTLGSLRAEGDSWLEISTARGVKVQDFYVIIVGNISSTTYAPIMVKFKSTPITMWHKLELSDQEIVNLVNLKFISSEHDYSIYKAMELRDQGKDFVCINREVKVLKADLIRKEKEQRKA